MCINAARADCLADPAEARNGNRAGTSTRAVAHTEDGRPQARERHPYAPREPEARSEGGTRPHPRLASGSAGVPRDREGLRPAARRAEVRARQGQSDPDAVPDLAQQDRRRPLGAPAGRARQLPAAIADVLVITGPSGVGKGTVIRLLLDRFPAMKLSVSATTRAPRPGEEHGVDYYFLSPDEFQQKIDDAQCLESAEYARNRYGTLRSELGRDAHPLVLEIEVQGARQVRARVRDAVSVFIAPPSEEALRTRLVGRGSDAPEQIERRLETAWGELAAEGEFDYVVVNDGLDAAVEELSRLVATLTTP